MQVDRWQTDRITGEWRTPQGRGRVASSSRLSRSFHHLGVGPVTSPCSNQRACTRPSRSPTDLAEGGESETGS